MPHRGNIFDLDFFYDLGALENNCDYIFYSVEPIQRRILNKHFNFNEKIDKPFLYKIRKIEKEV